MLTSIAALLWFSVGRAWHSFIHSLSKYLLSASSVPRAVLGSEDTKKSQKSLPSWNLHLECVGQGWRFRETTEDAVVITWARDDLGLQTQTSALALDVVRSGQILKVF